MVANINTGERRDLPPDQWEINADINNNPRHPGRLAREARAAQAFANAVGVDMATEVMGSGTSPHESETEPIP